MMNQFKTWLDRLPITDPLERRQAAGFQWVLLVWFLLAGLSNLYNFFFSSAGAPPPPTEAIPPIVVVMIVLLQIAGLTLLLAPVVALILLRRGRFRNAVTTATLGLLFAHTIATYMLGVTMPSVFVVFQIPIALAGLLADRRLLLGVAGWSIFVMIAVTILEGFSPPMAGFFVAVPDANGVIVSPLAGQNIWFDVGFFIGVTILITTLLDRFGGTLREVLTTALDREEDLKNIRASLEQTVSERTSALQKALDDVQARAAEQTQLLEEIEQQRVAIRDLSVPVIPISATTLVMPLVGSLDSTRLQQLQEQSLQALTKTSARMLIFDITGVPIVDTQVAQELLMTVQAARLLGAEVALVGIRPEVAQSIVGLGIDLRNIHTFSDLQSALTQMSALRPQRRPV